MDVEALTKAGLIVAPNGGAAVQLNQVLSATVPLNEDGLPDAIQLTPGGNRFAGRDGRSFRIRSPRQMVRDFNNSGEELQLDLDHESESFFGSTAAVGWVTSMELRSNREIWAQVEWTPQGAMLVTERTFRGISPTFLVDPASVAEFLEDNSKPMEVIGFQSVALTNRPNLPLRSLNTEQGTTNPTEEKQTMDIAKLFAALGLGEDASEADALNAIGALKQPTPTPEPNAAPGLPDLDKYVPRTDLDATKVKLAEANAKLKAQADAQHDTDVDTVIKSAIQAGKIAPASEEFYREVCSNAAGLAKTKAHLADAPVIVEPNEQIAPQDNPVASGNGLTPAQDHLCKMWGFTAEKFHEERAHLVKEGKLQG